MIIEKMFALKKVPLFRQLEDSELVLIAEAAVARRYERGAHLAAAGSVLNRLIIVVEGSVVWGETGEPAFPVQGIDSIVVEETLKSDLVAGSPDGAVCLLISKGHFYTIINEIPELLTAYLQSHPDDPGLT